MQSRVSRAHVRGLLDLEMVRRRARAPTASGVWGGGRGAVTTVVQPGDRHPMQLRETGAVQWPHDGALVSDTAKLGEWMEE